MRDFIKVARVRRSLLNLWKEHVKGTMCIAQGMCMCDNVFGGYDLVLVNRRDCELNVCVVYASSR